MDRFLAQRDQLFGFSDRKKSSVKKRRQVFDEKTNEHVTILEYRATHGEHSDPRKRKEASINRRVKHEEANSLMRDINDRVRLGFPRTTCSCSCAGCWPPRSGNRIKTPRMTLLLPDVHWDNRQTTTQRSGRQTAGTLPVGWTPPFCGVETGWSAVIAPCSTPLLAFADGW